MRRYALLTINSADMQLSNISSRNLLFWFAAIALLFIQLGATTTWQSEDRWLEVVREMLLSGNYFKPTLNGELYFDKPLLSYWLIIAAQFFLGALNEWTLRLPSVLSALLALWATIDLAKQLWNKEIAYKAGWILLTSFGFLQWARLGEADMENLAASIFAVSWYWRHRNQARLIHYLIFYAVIAVGAQCKGLTAIAVPCLALLPDLIRDGRFRKHSNLRHIIAIAIGAGIYLLPFFLAHGKIQDASTPTSDAGLALVIRENIVRYFFPFDHKEPFYTYFIAIPQYVFPWSFALIISLYEIARNNVKNFSHRGWLLSVIALIFLFFSLSGSRRNYYILPILPYCALLIAAYLHSVPDRLAARLTTLALIGVGITHLLVLPLWLPLQQYSGNALADTFRWRISIIGAAAVCGIGFIFWHKRHHRYRILYACIAGATIWLGGFFFYTQGVLDTFRSEADFSRQLALLVSAHPDAQIVTYREHPAGKLLFYANLSPDITVLKTPAELNTFIENTETAKIILAYHRYDSELPNILREKNPALQENQFKWEKNNREKMQAWLLAATTNR